MRTIVTHLQARGVKGSPDLDLKLLACRGLYPAFSAGLIGREGRTRVQAFHAELERLAAHYPASSAIWLNAGLVGCLAGAWDQGLDRLRAHARAANRFPAWYGLASHLPRRALVFGTPANVVREALDAIGRALAMRRHPLAVLTAAVLETGGANYGLVHLERRVAEFTDALSIKEEPSEVMRLYWCLQPSFRVLGRFEGPIRTTLEELSS